MANSMESFGRDNALQSTIYHWPPNGHTNGSLGGCICRVAKWQPNKNPCHSAQCCLYLFTTLPQLFFNFEQPLDKYEILPRLVCCIFQKVKRCFALDLLVNIYFAFPIFSSFWGKKDRKLGKKT